MLIYNSINKFFFMVNSIFGPPVNKVADQKAKEILDDPTVFWYMVPNRLGTPAWHYGNLLTAKLKSGEEANFLLGGDHSLWEICSFYFHDEPNKRLRLHWKTQDRLHKVATGIKYRNRLHLEKTHKDQQEELSKLTEERISNLGDV